MTKTEIQRRQRKRWAQVEVERARAVPPAAAPVVAEAKSSFERRIIKPHTYVIRPAPPDADDPGGYGVIIRQVLDFADSLPQPQVSLFEIIQRLMWEHKRRQAA
jgi:hypothetical protein